jgi:PKD repeat protein
VRRTTYIAIIIVISLMAACGGHSARQASSLLPVSPSATAQATDPYQLALNSLPADIRSEADALVAPKGCNPALFYALKKSFVQAIAQKLASGGKIALVAPSGDGNIVHGLTITPDGADNILSWNYRNTGDYDQSGAVGISDITPIAVHFGHPVGTDPLDIVIDGDGLGTVGIADITPLAVNFGVNVTSYTVEEATSEGGSYTTLGSVLLSSGTGADQGWIHLEYTLPDANARWLRVVPVDAQGNPGIASDQLEFNLGIPPEVVSVSPLSGATDAPIQFSAAVNGVGPFTYSWSFGGGATPDTSSDEQPSVVLSDTTGDYNCSLMVTNAAGSDTFDFGFTIGIPPEVSAVVPQGGVTGTDVMFNAVITGDMPMTYAWDFDGGALPDQSSEANPTATLGAPGAFGNASVTVTNPFGESFYGFTLTIYDAVPPEIISVSPTSGVRGDNTVITAVVNGAPPLSYLWEFGEAASPSTSTEATPLIVLTGLGTMPCTLSVDNAYGSDVFNFDLVISRDPAYDETEPNNNFLEANILPASPVVDWHCRLTQTDDENDFFSFPGVFGDKVDISAQLETDDPDINLELQDSAGNVLASSGGTADSENITYILSAADTYYIRCYYAGHTAVNAGDYWLDVSIASIQLDEVEDNDDLSQANPITFPLESFYGHCGAPDGYDGDVSDYFTFDAVANDELHVTLQQTDDSYDLDIYLLDGNGDELAGSYDVTGFEEFTYYFIPADTGPYYLYIDGCTDNGFYELNGTLEQVRLWSESVIDNTTSTDLGSYSALVDADGHPACFYYDAINGRILYAYSELADGTGNWTSNYCDTWLGVGSHLSAAMINGLPAVAYLDDLAGGVKFAICDSADGSGTWNYGMIDSLADRGPSVASIGGYPAISYGDSSGNVHFAINGEAGGGGSWYTYPVTTTGPGAWSTSLIELSTGFPCIAYDSTNTNELRLAVCDAADGSGTWTVNLAGGFGTGSTPTSAGLTTNYPSIAAIWNDRPIFYRGFAEDGSGGWAGYYASPIHASGEVSLAAQWGWPRILLEDDLGDLYYGLSIADSGIGGWMTRPVRRGASVGSNRSFGYVGGNLCCVFYDTTNHYVGFAYPTS